MKKVLWFSRHPMSAEQLSALGDDVVVSQVSKTISSARELAEEIEAADIVAIVAPIGLQSEFLKLAGEKPVIVAVSERLLVNDETTFKFVKWERLIKIEVLKEDFVPVKPVKPFAKQCAGQIGWYNGEHKECCGNCRF